METMHPTGRRSLPPVPRPATDAELPSDDESPAEQTTQLRRDDVPKQDRRPDEDIVPTPEVLAAADEPEIALDDDDPAQDFVTQLRAAAADFAAAAGARSAMVREAVPPARHRRSRCRIVLRYADGAEADLTFVGAIGRPGTPAWDGFDEQIQRWLGTGQQRQPAWLVEDTEASDGVAVDVPAWLAAG
jgi:hypothetical protein